MDIPTFIIMLMFLWIINATINGALYYIYKDKKVLFQNLTIGYTILFVAYIFFYLRIENETYVITFLANVLYFIGNLFIIKGLYTYINMKETIKLKAGIILTIIFILLFTLMFSLGDFYYRNILNAFYPMIAYIVILIQKFKIDKHLYKRAVMIVLFIHVLASVYRIIVSIAASSSLDFYNLVSFNVLVYAFGQLALVFLGQFIVIGTFFKTVRELDEKNKLLSNSVLDLKEVSETDSLTETYNRRYGDIVLEKLYLDFKNNNTKFSVMLTDIDGFKKINDSFGHIRGDEILIWISRYLESRVRNTDFVVRWGGDEFLIIFTHSNEEHKDLLVNQVMSEIETQSLKDLKLAINLSYGYSSIVKHDSLNSLLIDADQRMYQNKAKNKTKNKTKE